MWYVSVSNRLHHSYLLIAESRLELWLFFHHCLPGSASRSSVSLSGVRPLPAWASGAPPVSGVWSSPWSAPGSSATSFSEFFHACSLRILRCCDFTVQIMNRRSYRCLERDLDLLLLDLERDRECFFLLSLSEGNKNSTPSYYKTKPYFISQCLWRKCWLTARLNGSRNERLGLSDSLHGLFNFFVGCISLHALIQIHCHCQGIQSE